MFDHVLVPLDGSSLAEAVLPHVVAIAQAFESRVTLLQVLERGQTPHRMRVVDPLDWYITEAEARAYLEDVSSRLQDAGLQVESQLLEGPAADRVVDFVHENQVGLVILSSHGRSGLSGWNVSSVVQKIAMRAYVPVMIVRAYQDPPPDFKGLRYQRLLLPLDCSQRAETVLAPAVILARHNESVPLIVHVVSPPRLLCRTTPTAEEQQLADRLLEWNRAEAERYLEQLQSRVTVPVETRLIAADNPAMTLHDLVDREAIDLVMLSAHGYSGVARWPYGSLTISFMSYGTSPLLIMQDLSPEELAQTRAEKAAQERRGH